MRLFAESYRGHTPQPRGKGGGGRERGGTTDNYSREVLWLGSTNPDQVNSLSYVTFSH